MLISRSVLFIEIIGGYYAYCPLLPGCATQGETYAEAVANIEDAIKGMVEAMVAHGDPLPFKLPRAARFA